MARISVKTARRSKKVEFSLPCTHTTTLDVGQLRPTNIMIASPEDTFKVNFGQSSQLSPLLVPSMGSMSISTFAFFVPFRCIWDNFEDFIDNSVDNSLGVSQSRPRFTYADIINLFFLTSTPDPTNGNHYDSRLLERLSYNAAATDLMIANAPANDVIVLCPNGSNGTKYGAYRFTAKGRWFMNVFRSLGYEFPEVVITGDFSGYSASDLITGVSAFDYTTYNSGYYYNGLPLLAFARCLFDYVYPSAYVQQLNLGYLFHDCTVGGSVYSWQWLSDCMKLLFVPYEQDFFTSLWSSQNSVSASSGASSLSNHNENVTGSNYLSVRSSLDSSYVLQTNSSGSASASTSTSLSSSALRYLQAMSDFVIRNNIGGTRFHEWMKAHFGFVTNQQDAHRSQFLKSWKHEVSISPVTNQGMTADSLTGVGVLGEKAGQAYSRGSGQLTFDAKEHGFLMFVTMVVPHTGYYQGLAPWCRDMLSSRFNFFTPGWENLGLEAIPRSSVMACPRVFDTLKVPIERQNEVFGFAPRYAEMYKIGRDYLTGDFRFDSRNKNLEAYHTYRDVLYGRNNLALDAQFMSVDNQFDRIFAYVNDPNGDPNSVNNTDKIFSIFQFAVKKYSYMQSVGESMPLFNKSGDETNLNYQGTQLK